VDTYWRKFAEEYVNDPFYWFQPKGFTVSRGNLPGIRKKLRQLKRFEGRPWRRAQRGYAGALRRAGLFRPTRATAKSADYAAIARMNKKVLDSLGVAWITDESIVQITEAGREFLRLPSRGLPDFVHRQLCRCLLYTSPSPRD